MISIKTNVLTIVTLFALLMPQGYAARTNQVQKPGVVQLKIDRFKKEHGFNVDNWLYAKGGQLPYKISVMALQQKESDCNFTQWDSFKTVSYATYYSKREEGIGEAGVGIDTSGEVIRLIYTFYNKAENFGPDLLDYFYAKYGDNFYRQFTKNHAETYQFVHIMKSIGKLRTLWLQTFSSTSFSVVLGHQVLTPDLIKSIEKQLKKNKLNNVLPNWIPYSRKALLDTESLENNIEKAVRKHYPRVQVRVRNTEGIVHFYFDNRKLTNDESYFSRLVAAGIKMVVLAKEMHRNEANWIGSKLFFTLDDVVWGWVYIDDCEYAEQIDDLKEKGSVISKIMHWVKE